jgi:hypothetical protein
MTQYFTMLAACLLSASIVPAAGEVEDWRIDRALTEAYHSDLAAGRPDGAILKVIEWCTEKYQNGIKAKNLDDKSADRLASDIQKAAKALRFVRDHDAEIRKLDDGTRSFNVFLGCFEVLFEMHPLRDGSGERYEESVKTYYEARRVTERLVVRDAKRTAEQAGAGQPATTPESKPEGGEKPKLEPKSAPR